MIVSLVVVIKEPTLAIVPHDGAACREYPAEFWHVEQGHSYSEAKTICHGCDIRRQCLNYAMKYEGDDCDDLRFGVWGGLTPEERETLSRSGWKVGDPIPDVVLKKPAFRLALLPEVS
jgi:hypothetical protein